MTNKQKPVAWRWYAYGEHHVTLSESKMKFLLEDGAAIQPLYTHPAVAQQPVIPEALLKIGELIRTQDNRVTDQPLFAVMQKREYVGAEDYNCGVDKRIVWVFDSEVEADERTSRRLEALHTGCRDTRGWERFCMIEVNEFVTACFTEQGCKDYLKANGHNLKNPFIYAFGSYRNAEFQAVRSWLATAPAQQSVIPEGYKLVPIEPTEDMIVDGFESVPHRLFSDREEWEKYDAMSGCQQAAHRAKLCWQAMIAAAPAPEDNQNG